jgi:precorrin-6B methylase 2
MSFDHIIGGTTKIDGVLQGSKQGVKKGHKKVLNYLSHEGVVPKT